MLVATNAGSVLKSILYRERNIPIDAYTTLLNLEILKNLVALTFVAKAWERLSKLEKLLKYWNLKDTGASYNRVFTDNTAKSS